MTPAQWARVLRKGSTAVKATAGPGASTDVRLPLSRALDAMAAEAGKIAEETR